jgi:hypothetical protein
MKQAGQQIKHFFQDLKQLVQFLFSYDGKLNVVQFIMVILMVRALFHPFGAQVKYLPQISYWLDLASFYCVIAAVQKSLFQTEMFPTIAGVQHTAIINMPATT